MSTIWHGNTAGRYVIKAKEDDPLPEGFVLLADEAARDAWTASFHVTPAFTPDDYTKVLNDRIDAVARQMRYKHIESMKGYAGYINDWQEQCLPFAQWDARVWKKVDELEKPPPEGPLPTPAQFADLVFALVPPPPITI